ncbi:MAG: dTDP-4-dehydrorhamnose reductase [Pseudomonadota bacterium]
MLESPRPERVLVTGAGGQLGQALVSQCPAGVNLLACDRASLDISSAAAIAEHLDRFQPQLLINAAAYTAVDKAESERADAFRINGQAPGLLAAACAERAARFIHVSTDFVFDGQSGSPYEPDSRTSPQSVYGASKLAGEEAVGATRADALILRTSWVYSAGGGNFLSTMLRLHRERDEIAVVADQIGTPTSAASLAATLWSFAARPQLRGIYHFSDAGACSWYDFAVAIGEEAQTLGILEHAARVLPIRTAAYPTPARRPAYSVLDKTSTWHDADIEPRHWRECLRDTLKEMSGNG